MNLETPYRSSAASSLDMKVIELGNWLEKLEQYGPNIEKLSIEISNALKIFGYKRLHHIDIPVNHDCLFCINYYNLSRRLVVLSSERVIDNHGFGCGHYDYYAHTLEIDYDCKCNIVHEITKRNSISRRLANRLLPGIGTKKDSELYHNIKKSSCKIDSFRSFLSIF